MNDKAKKIRVLISCMVTMLMLGIIYLWSIFKTPVKEYLGWSNAQAATVFSVMLPMNVCGIMAGGFLNDKRGPRFVLTLGACLAVCGMLITSFVTASSPGLFYFTYAIMVGFGAGLINNTCLSMVQKWWYDKKGFAVGLTNCAYALSSVVFAPTITLLIKSELNLPGTFRVLAALFLLIVVVFGRFIRKPPEGWVRSVEQKKVKENVTGRQYRPGVLVRSPIYYMLILCMVCMTNGYLMLNSMFKDYGIAKGLTEAVAVSAVMMSGIGSAVGRLLIAWLTDRIDTIKIMIAVYVIVFCSMGAMFFAGGWAYAVCVACISFCYGASSSLTSIINVESFGSKYLSSNYGLMTVAVLISGIISPNLSTALSRDGIPTSATLILPMVLSVVGMISITILSGINKKDGADQ